MRGCRRSWWSGSRAEVLEEEQREGSSVHLPGPQCVLQGDQPCEEWGPAGLGFQVVEGRLGLSGEGCDPAVLPPDQSIQWGGWRGGQELAALLHGEPMQERGENRDL